MTKLVLKIGNGESNEIAIPEQGVTIGRNQACDLPIVEPSVSGNHGSIRFERGEWWVHDNNSSNGTFVNGAQVTDQVLKAGDQVKFGNVEAEFVTVPDVPPAAEPEQKASGLKLAHKLESRSGLKLSGKKNRKEEPKKEEKKAVPVPEKVETPVNEEPEMSLREEMLASVETAETKWKAPELKVNKDEKIEALGEGDVALIAELNEKYAKIKDELSQVVIGQSSVVEEVLIAVFSRGHALLMGVPGLAKTLLISTLSHVLDLGFKRVQFTPDLMPSDITGTDVLEEDKATGQRQFRFVKGPIFTNMLLADEINRTPPKTQAALLEAMQEHHITVGSMTYHLSEPFFVLATQNPIEQEGTYPLPEAQLDRFLFNIIVDYPSAEEESLIIANVTGAKKAKLSKILDGDSVIRIQELLRRVPVASHVIDYARNLARATRPKQPEAPDFVKEMVGWGAGPRAGISLIQAAKARAVLYGRHHVTTADVTAVATPVLRHRVITTFAAEAAGVTSDDVIRMLLKALKPREELEV